MHRLQRYGFISASNIISKAFLFINRSTGLNAVILMAGLYKPSSAGIEHGLILSTFCGLLPSSNFQFHGKRQKRTTSLSSKLVGFRVWSAIDKIVNELLPRINDFRSPKFNKPATASYTLRLKEKFNPLKEFEELVTLEMFEKNKGIFLPLSLHFHLKNCYQELNQHRLRMLRLPFTFYVKHPAPAFDDLATVAQ